MQERWKLGSELVCTSWQLNSWPDVRGKLKNTWYAVLHNYMRITSREKSWLENRDQNDHYNTSACITKVSIVCFVFILIILQWHSFGNYWENPRHSSLRTIVPLLNYDRADIRPFDNMAGRTIVPCIYRNSKQTVSA